LAVSRPAHGGTADFPALAAGNLVAEGHAADPHHR